MAELKCSREPAERLVTYALGSCLAVAVHDPAAGVAGLLHVMMPDSVIDPGKAAANPAMFVDTGVPMLFKSCYALGAKKERMTVIVAGGAHQGDNEEDDRFRIGKRNFAALRKLLWRNGVMIGAAEVGGSRQPRTLWMDVGSGEVLLKVNGRELALKPAGG
ncbi:MAG: chemotaxis protein CheD [Gemmatimonadetes bacterium]|nr:chemotaxis protein CheD [Gemmatimonadota bacterium]MBI3569279.1 chemotaxis protein CheD [Gemmatimonadota bacterium]